MKKIDKLIEYQLNGITGEQFSIIKKAILSDKKIEHSDGLFVCLANNIGEHRYIYASISFIFTNKFRAFILTKDKQLLQINMPQSELCSELAFLPETTTHTMEELDKIIASAKTNYTNIYAEEYANEIDEKSKNKTNEPSEVEENKKSKNRPHETYEIDK